MACRGISLCVMSRQQSTTGKAGLPVIAKGAIRTTLRAIMRAVLRFLLVSVLLLLPGFGQAQPSGPVMGRMLSDAPDTAATLPEAPSPELVDAMLATLTDAEVRALLQAEMKRQAASRVAEAETGLDTIESITARFERMIGVIATRIGSWPETHLTDWTAVLDARIAEASWGLPGLLLALLAVTLAGLGAARAAARLPATLHHEIARQPSGDYWTRLLRGGLLILIAMAPVAAFWAAVTLTTQLLQAPLGPLAGFAALGRDAIVNCWVFLIVLQRAFAPEAPALRIASVDDPSAIAVVRSGRRVLILCLAGWLPAGVMVPLGLGEAAMLIMVAATGVAVTGMLIVAVLRNRAAIEATVLTALAPPRSETAAPWQRSLASAAPIMALLYLAFAGSYAVLRWLETGTLHLLGPASTGLVLLLVPILDRFGAEMARVLTRRATPRGLRFRSAILRVWRAVLAGTAIGVITRLWGFNFFDLAHGPQAPAWGAPALNVVWALVIAWSAWQFVRAALWIEARVSEDADEDSAPEDMHSSRLDTLVPLLRLALGVVTVLTLSLYALAQANVNIAPLLASAGIVGIALGFGAQSLVRDILSGAFFLLDDAFRVGEYVEIEGDLKGEVEAISLRSLQLRHHLGAVVTIPFGELRSVANHNRDWVICKMNFRMEPDTDPKRLKKLVKSVGVEFLEHLEHGHKFIEPVKSQGVYMIDDDSALVFRVKFKCKPRQQFVLRREIYHRLREIFAENDLHLARRKVEVVSTGGNAPAPALPEDVLLPQGTTRSP